MTETVLINVKLEGTENEAKINSLSKSINDLNEENKKLIENNKKLAKAEGDNSAEIAKNSSQIELNKQKITESSASRKGLIQTIVAEDNSIKALTVRNTELRKQRDLINTSTEEGRKKIQQINAEIDKNNGVIKENNDALGAQKINIGNYASALDSVVPGLGGMITGIQGATKASLAFIATPLGAVLAALGLALAAMNSYLKGSEEGQDKLAEASAILSVALNKIMVIVEAIGESLFNGAEGIGSFTDKLGVFGIALEIAITPLRLLLMGLQKISEITGFDTIVQDTVKTGKAIAALNDEIEANENELIIKRAETNAKVQALREKAITQEGNLKRKTVSEAIQLEKDLAKLETEQLQNKLKAFDIEAKTTGRLTEEQKKQRAELVAAIIDANSQGAQSTIKFQKELEKLNDEASKKKDEQTKKELENIAKIQEAEDKAYLAKLKRQEEEDERRGEGRTGEDWRGEERRRKKRRQQESNGK